MYTHFSGKKKHILVRNGSCIIFASMLISLSAIFHPFPSSNSRSWARYWEVLLTSEHRRTVIHWYTMNHVWVRFYSNCRWRGSCHTKYSQYHNIKLSTISRMETVREKACLFVKISIISRKIRRSAIFLQFTTNMKIRPSFSVAVAESAQCCSSSARGRHERRKETNVKVLGTPHKPTLSTRVASSGPSIRAVLYFTLALAGEVNLFVSTSLGRKVFLTAVCGFRLLLYIIFHSHEGPLVEKVNVNVQLTSLVARVRPCWQLFPTVTVNDDVYSSLPKFACTLHGNTLPDSSDDSLLG